VNLQSLMFNDTFECVFIGLLCFYMALPYSENKAMSEDLCVSFECVFEALSFVYMALHYSKNKIVSEN